jgi:transcriptional regulator with XRE-family HTH domain
MAQKRGTPGSKKGQPKPMKRQLDSEFKTRFAVAVGNRAIPELAKKVGCSRAALGNYLNGRSKTIEALLLFQLAKELDVSARWLLTGQGVKADESGQLRKIQRWLDQAEPDEKHLFFQFTEKFLIASEK